MVFRSTDAHIHHETIRDFYEKFQEALDRFERHVKRQNPQTRHPESRPARIFRVRCIRPGSVRTGNSNEPRLAVTSREHVRPRSKYPNSLKKLQLRHQNVTQLLADLDILAKAGSA